jgi:2-phosphosulfolactate phosphatase
MKFQQATLETCETLTDTVVVIDVLRAFSTAAYAFAAGVKDIALASTVDEALRLKQRYPEAHLIGEDRGLPIDGFEFGNSPAHFVSQNYNGQRLIQRTSAGTQGVVRSTNAEVLLSTSLCCAQATAAFLIASNPAMVSFVITGAWSDDQGEEDRACADYIEQLIKGEGTDLNEIIQRVISSAAAWKFLDPYERAFPISDLEYCTVIDRFDFAMVVERRNNLLLMRPEAISI